MADVIDNDIDDAPEMAGPFRPYGNPPPFNLDEYKDSFDIWAAQWSICIKLSTIDTVLAKAERPEY